MAGLGALAVFLAVAFTPLPNVLARRLVTPPRVERAQAIVVLGGGIEDARTLSPASLRRTIHGILLYRRGLAPVLIFSGGRAGQDAAEAVVMAAVAVALGIPETAIWIEDRSDDTWTEAREVARLAQARGVRKILLVTDRFHMKRASAVFERAGFQVLPASWDGTAENVEKPEARLDLMRQVSREFLARVYYFLRARL